MQRREFLQGALSLGAVAFLPGVGLSASRLLGNTPPITASALPLQIAVPDYPPLIRAILLGQVDTVKSLVRQGGNVNERWGEHGFTPLHEACGQTLLELVKRIHFYNPVLETHPIEEFYGHRIKHPEASAYRDYTAFLESFGIDWRSQTKNDGSPIHLPSVLARREIVKFLIDSGADIEAKNGGSVTPLCSAAQTSDIELLQYLFRLGVKRDFKGDENEENFAVHAALFSDSRTMQFLVKSGIDIHACNSNGATLLHYAARNYDVSVMKYLIDLGLDPHAEDWNGHRPIHSAAWNGCVETVRYLVGLRADVNTKTTWEGHTPLHYVCDTRIARFLIDAGADIEVKDFRKSVPLHNAARNNHPGIAKLLLEASANIHAHDDWKRTPLHEAAYNGSTETAKLLINLGADTMAKDTRHDATPLHFSVEEDISASPIYKAAENDRMETVKLLIASGVDLDAKNWLHQTPLHLAAKYGKTETAKLLIASGADLTARSFTDTPLHVAAENGKTETATLLIASGADLMAKRYRDWTPLHQAASYGHVDTVQMLLYAGADLEAVTDYGATPLHLAMSAGNLEMANYLVGQGADPSGFTFDAEVVLVAAESLSLALTFYPDEVPCARVRFTARGNDWIGKQIRTVAMKKDIQMIECEPTLLQDIFDSDGSICNHHAAIASACPGIVQAKGLIYDSEKKFFVNIVS